MLGHNIFDGLPLADRQAFMSSPVRWTRSIICECHFLNLLQLVQVPNFLRMAQPSLEPPTPERDPANPAYSRHKIQRGARIREENLQRPEAVRQKFLRERATLQRRRSRRARADQEQTMTRRNGEISVQSAPAILGGDAQSEEFDNSDTSNSTAASWGTISCSSTDDETESDSSPESDSEDILVLWASGREELEGCCVRVTRYEETPCISQIPAQSEDDLRVCISMPRPGGRWELDDVNLCYPCLPRDTFSHSLRPLPHFFNFNRLLVALPDDAMMFTRSFQQ